MRILKQLLVAIIILFLFCSCTRGGINLAMELSPNDKNLKELSTKIYSESELLDIVALEGSIQELNKKYPIECVREISAGYRVSYIGETNLAVIIFDVSGQKMMGNIYKISKSKEYFDNLSNGNSLESVQRIDPNGNYLFLYSGRNDIPRQSIHYTSDGYMITIDYDEQNNISDISSEFI